MFDFLIDPVEDPLTEVYNPQMSLPSDQAQLIPSPSSTVFPQRLQKDINDVVALAVATRLQYSIDELVKAPKTMIKENQTPWCHHRLYENDMPRSMQGLLMQDTPC